MVKIHQQINMINEQRARYEWEFQCIRRSKYSLAHLILRFHRRISPSFERIVRGLQHVLGFSYKQKTDDNRQFYRISSISNISPQLVSSFVIGKFSVSLQTSAYVIDYWETFHQMAQMFAECHPSEPRTSTRPTPFKQHDLPTSSRPHVNPKLNCNLIKAADFIVTCLRFHRALLSPCRSSSDHHTAVYANQPVLTSHFATCVHFTDWFECKLSEARD